MTNPAEYRHRADRLLGDLDHARRTVAEESENLDRLRRDSEHATEAQKILQAVAQSVQERAHEQVARVVSHCLKTVFGDAAYEFRVLFRRQRGKTTAELVFVRDGHEIRPCDAAGGGVVDVAAFALRLACLLLAVPRRRKLLVMDEPMRMLSRGHAPRVRELFEALSRELGVQLILVTHDPALAAGKVVEIGMD